MKILFLAAEVAPFVSVGGLSQATYFLPKALRQLGHDVRIFTPKYGAMDEVNPKKNLKLGMQFSQLAVPVNGSSDDKRTITCNVKSFVDAGKLNAYFLENREYYELRANVYGYKDDHVRFALLSKGCLEWIYQIKNSDKADWFPDIIHCHDWHTGYFIDLARRHPRYIKMLDKTPIVFTVHNFNLQGNFDFRYASKDEYDYGRTPLASLLSSNLQAQNPLKRGLLFADAVNTVSPTHAVEVMTPEYSEGLDDILHEAREKLTGILNGLDTKTFNPLTDKTIQKQFNVDAFTSAREENKKQLQKFFELTQDAHSPLLAFCGRLSKQKGLDFLLEVLPHLLIERPDVQIVFLGSGEERYRLELTVLQKNFPGQIGLHLRPDFSLPRKIFAGADMLLLPSLYEPGGIVALEGLRYGCVPIVRRTGGLNDIITDFHPKTKKGNGFSFKQKDSWSLFGTIIEALTIYQYPRIWRTLVKNALQCDFSWNHTAKEYESWYKRIIEEPDSRKRQRRSSHI